MTGNKVRLTLFFLGGAALAAAFFLLHPFGASGKCMRVSYVNPDFACGNNVAISKGEYSSLENDISAYILQQKNAQAVKNVSVYFRDLRNGPTLGINANDDYAPASLLKLPTIMAMFNRSEEDRTLMAVPLKYAQSEIQGLPATEQHEKPTPDIKEGGTYTMQDLMRNTIEYSDNLSFYVLLKYMNYTLQDGPGILLRSFQELGVVDPRTPDESTVSVREYAGLFRMLYNASYLSVEDSETLLDWLAHSTYNKGIAAGVPKGVTVANKFGERPLDDGTKQLHDCGIIYFPNNPYTLCVMTQGADWDTLAGVIATISKMVYAEVESRKK